MKKLVTIVLTMALVLSMSVPVLAAIAEGGVSTGSDAGYITVKVSNGYVGDVTIQFTDKDTKELVEWTVEVNGNATYTSPYLRSQTQGKVSLIGDYTVTIPDVEEEEVPYIIGMRTITTTTFGGYTKDYSFIADQKNKKGPKANFISATITESYTIDTKVYDVWSNEVETLNEEASSIVTVPVIISGVSNPLPNGSETNYLASFTDGLGGYSVYVTYKGNGNKFSCTEIAPVRDTVETDVYDYFE